MAADNQAWSLEEFVDSLVVELDRTRDTLAIKAINKPLTYSVKDMSLDLNIFPSYDGDEIKFTTAQPGQQGASKVTIQLGSITDQQVRVTTKTPSQKDDISIDDINVDAKTKKKLRTMGVNTVDDLKQIEKKHVDIQKASDNTIDYSALANQIQKSTRNQNPPKVRSVSLSMSDDRIPYLVIKGNNLVTNPQFKPVAVVNSSLAEVVEGNEREMKVKLDASHKIGAVNELILTVDPFAVVKLNVKV